MTPRDKAKELMRHYLRMIAEQSGIDWQWDNNSEVDEMVDCLIDAAAFEERVKELTKSQEATQ